jgi:hypothetical protein
MAEALQKFYGLPVLRVQLGQLDGRPCAVLSLVDNTSHEINILDTRSVTLDAFGLQDIDPSYDDLGVPDDVVSWVSQWVHQSLDPSSVLWMHFKHPYGVLGAMPWERDLQPAIGIPLLRIPDAFPEQDRSTSTLELALVATAPAAEGPSLAAQMGARVARAIAAGIGERLRLHVFGDLEARDFLRGELAGLPVREVLVHDVEEPRRTDDQSGELRNGWLRWIRQAMAGRTLDAVHFNVHGNALGQDGAILTPLEPDSPDRAWPISVQSGEIKSFLTQVGALVVGFSRPPDNYSDFGLRRLVDDLGAVRAGPVVLHDQELDQDFTGLQACYAFLTAPAPGFPPATPSLMLMAQPKQVYVPESPLLPTSAGDDLPAPGDAVKEHFEREETPMWLGAAERYLEQQQGELIRYRQSLDLDARTPTSSEQAYFAGVESAIRKVRQVVDKYAQEAL